jgi:AcrR family transcriptional regulator
MPRLVTDDSAPTIDRVLTSAAQLFADKGFAATTTREVAEHAGIKRATLYHYIGSKEELLARLCHEAFSQVEGSVDRAIAEAAPDPIERLRAAIVAHVTAVLASRELQTVMLLELRSLDTDEHSKDLVARRAKYEQRFRTAVEHAQKSGALRSDIPSSLLVLSLFNLCNWTLIWYKDEGRYSAKKLGGTYADLFIEGAQAR